MPTDYRAEAAFFDRVAATAVVEPMSPHTLARYAKPARPHLFGKEFMFSLLGDAGGKRVLEVGCGEGVASVQLAHCGAAVTGVDISPGSVAVARRRAVVQGVDAAFRVADVAGADDLGEAEFDVVWCDLILHHLVNDLDAVLGKLRRALKPGGLFIAREPVAYAGWLKRLRSVVPVRVDATDDERPLGVDEFAVLARHFPTARRRYFRILARIDRVTPRLGLIALAARADNLLLRLPGTRGLAGNAVVWARV